MNEEMDTANHSGNEEVYDQEMTSEPIEKSAEGVDSPPQEEPKGIKVKYNKEERFVPEDEVPNWVQKGLNYDKISEKAQQAERYQQNLDRIAKFYGYDNHDDYITVLEQAEMERNIQAEAERMGVDEEVIRNHLQPLNQKVNDYERQLNELKEADALRQVESQISNMERDSDQFPDFAKHKSTVLSIAAQRGYSLEDAYKIATYEERVNTARLQAQQEAVRNLQQNADSSTGSLGADSPEQANGYSGMSAAEKKALRDSVRGRAN